MTGKSTALLCPKCHCKLLWNGLVYRCISCEFQSAPKRARKDNAGKPRRSGPKD